MRKPEEYTAWQMPQSWGAMYSGRVWDRFLLFEKETVAPGDTPFALSNRWPYDASWKRILMRMMYKEGTSLLYPPLRYGGVSIPTSLSSAIGKNSKGGHHLDGRLMTISAPRIGAYQYYNMYGGNKIEALDPGTSDACSFVYSVCRSISSLKRFLQKASGLGILGEIILIVQPCNGTSALAAEVHKWGFRNLRVRFLQFYDRNERFLLRDVKYDCMIHADEDSSDVPAGAQRAFEFFRMGYSDRIIGSTDTSALVRYDQIAEKWVYLLDRKFEQVRNTGGGGWSIGYLLFTRQVARKQRVLACLPPPRSEV